MTRSELLSEIKIRLQAAFGSRLRGVVLYGSEARGQAAPDSDLDLLVLMKGPPTDADRRDCIHVLYPLVLHELNGRPIHCLPVEEKIYEAQEYPLYRNVHREGVLV